MLTVLTWLWAQPRGRTKFAAHNVNIWADMVRRNLSTPHEIACVTATPQGIDPSIRIITPPGEFEDVQPKWGPRKPNCFRRLAMFRRDAAKIFGKRFVCMDLDCVVGGPLDPLFDRKEDLVLFKGTADTRPYNGSMMLIKAGCRPHVYEDFNQAGADISGTEFVGSDQAWLAHKLGWNETTWDEADGVYWYGKRYLRERKRVTPRLLFFPGKVKPWDLARFRVDPFITSNYSIEAREAA
jgi:hypothetical protein